MNYISTFNFTSSENIGPSESVFDNEAVRASKSFLSSVLVNGGKRWTCGLCDAVGIKHITRHCETVRHQNLLQIRLRDNEKGNQSSSNQPDIFENDLVKLSADILEYDRIDGHKVWRCILCNVDGMRTLDLVDHCANLKHITLLNNRTQDTVNGQAALSSSPFGGGNLYYNAMNSEHVNHNSSLNIASSENTGPSENVYDNEAVRASRSFLSSARGHCWNCDLCDAVGIKQIGRAHV